MINKYGKCECGTVLEAVWFTDEEYDITNGRMTKTGRTRRAVDYLMCGNCMKKYTVDDSLDMPFR